MLNRHRLAKYLLDTINKPYRPNVTASDAQENIIRIKLACQAAIVTRYLTRG
ncbi:hypothetical protein Q7C_2697 [Methylophaga frappieri]|uniref:Uncharacterized protein n=1 Tax=Methylophaga frappieri (strain ATCC BAA-2434 / DSM 25690 / JAM7) TaxID=754477 RepID=I1YLM4_METFJ|nr:hypothetical protein Q7C_2697 [Methylophaga frappieri]